MLVRRTLFFILGGIFLGGVIHIAIVFMVPYYANQDAWAVMHRFGRDGQFHVLPTPEAGAEPLASLDPRMIQAVCRFNLTSGPVHIGATFDDEFWSVAVFDRRGRNIYSLNDRSADRSRLDLAILTPVQMAKLRQDPPASLESAIVLEAPISVGFVLLRAFVPDDSLAASVSGSLKAAECSKTL
jgi:uncharacterized membrane protein